MESAIPAAAELTRTTIPKRARNDKTPRARTRSSHSHPGAPGAHAPRTRPVSPPAPTAAPRQQPNAYRFIRLRSPPPPAMAPSRSPPPPAAARPAIRGTNPPRRQRIVRTAAAAASGDRVPSPPALDSAPRAHPAPNEPSPDPPPPDSPRPLPGPASEDAPEAPPGSCQRFRLHREHGGQIPDNR